eukprot:366336-Chlamydomonas_euryale.AAC.4
MPARKPVCSPSRGESGPAAACTAIALSTRSCAPPASRTASHLCLCGLSRRQRPFGRPRQPRQRSLRAQRLLLLQHRVVAAWHATHCAATLSAVAPRASPHAMATTTRHLRDRSPCIVISRYAQASAPRTPRQGSPAPHLWNNASTECAPPPALSFFALRRNQLRGLRAWRREGKDARA